MDDRLSEIEVRLRDHDATLADVLERLARLEAHDREVASAARLADTVAAATLPEESELQPTNRQPAAEPSGLLSFVGRTCVVLGGAYLLRALTESGHLADSSGIALGFAYAATWLVAADHAGARRPVSGVFHGLAAVAIGLPLLWEASTRFQILGPVGSAVALGLLVTLGLGVAWHRRLQGLALAVVSGTVITAIALSLASRQPLPYAFLLSVVGLVSWRIGHTCGWQAMPWGPAFGALLLSTLVIGQAMADPPLEAPSAAMMLLGFFAVANVALFVDAVSRRRQPLDLFALLQTAAALIVGAGGAALVAADAGSPYPPAVASGMLVLGGTVYGIALAMGRRRSADDWYPSTVALTLVIAGVTLLLEGRSQQVVWLALILFFASGARATSTTWLDLHAAAFTLAAVATSKLLVFASRVWSSPFSEWPEPPMASWMVILITAGLLMTRPADGVRPRAVTASRSVFAVVFTLGLATITVWALATALPALASDPEQLSTLRTIVLAGSAMAAAAVARRRLGPEIGWLAYPAIVAGAAKLLLEDFRIATPAMLFVALAVYGLGLIVTSRLRAARTRSADGAA